MLESFDSSVVEWVSLSSWKYVVILHTSMETAVRVTVTTGKQQQVNNNKLHHDDVPLIHHGSTGLGK